MEHTITLLGYSLAWALLSSLPQALLVFMALYLLLKMFPSMPAPGKYAMAYAALLGIFGWFLATWYMEYGSVTHLSAADGGSAVSSSGSGRLYELTLRNRRLGGQGFLLRLEQYFPYLLFTYLAGLSFFALRFVAGVVEAWRLRYADVNTTTQLQQLTSKWSHALRITGRVQVYLSGRVIVPMMTGAIRPVILLPVATVNNLSAEQLEAIIIHELAHIKRHDYLLNTVQVMIETVLFFNPLIWACSAIIRREREHSCDDIVVAHTQPFCYARALAKLEEQRQAPAGLVLAATGNNNQLLHRIKRIMNMNNNSTHYNRPAIVVTALVAFGLVMAFFTPSFGQKAKQSAADSAAHSKSAKQKEVVVREHTTTNAGPGKTKSTSTLKVNVSVTDDGDGTGNRKTVRKTITRDGNVETEDLAGVSAQVAAALAEARTEIGNVDWDAIKSEIRQALAEVDRTLSDKELHREIKASVQKGLNEAHKELARAQRELDKAHADARTATKHVTAKVVTTDGDQDVEEMLEEMDGNGLIDRSGAFKIEKRDGDLYVNGQKQSAKVSEHYRNYVHARNMTVNGAQGALTVNISE